MIMDDGSCSVCGDSARDCDCIDPNYYGEYVDQLIIDLNMKTPLVWEWMSTGGGCDALVAPAFRRCDEHESDPCYVMVTSDLSIPMIGRDTFVMFGLYDDDDELIGEMSVYGEDRWGAPAVTLSDLEFFVEKFIYEMDLVMLPAEPNP